MDRAERARDEEGNVIDPTMLPKKHQENKNINTTTKQRQQHQEQTSVEWRFMILTWWTYQLTVMSAGLIWTDSSWKRGNQK